MRVSWDERKRQRNLEVHGLDFAEIEADFELAKALIVPTYPGTDGRPRFIAIGLLGHEFVSLVFAPLGTEALSAVSFRPSSRKERRAYAEHQAKI